MCPTSPRCTGLPTLLHRSWQIGKKGELTEVATRPKAHNDRITGITLRGNNFLYSGKWGLLLETHESFHNLAVHEGAAPANNFFCLGGVGKGSRVPWGKV